jgi:hypothetical protein
MACRFAIALSALLLSLAAAAADDPVSILRIACRVERGHRSP